MAVVQFPHPGPEHLTDNNGAAFGNAVARNVVIHSGYIPWNDGDHRRKFFSHKGNYVDSNKQLFQNKNIYFWGEWEAPSKFKHLVCNGPDTPHFGHNQLYAHDPASYLLNINPIIPDPPRNSFDYPPNPRLQNTDPYVFGKHFIYSNCRQKKGSKLLNLAPGSVIFFGSKVNQGFVLDTVFVVEDSKKYLLKMDKGFFTDLINDGWISETFYNVTIRALQDDPSCDPNQILVLYKGVTYNNRFKFDGMYSFFPCSKENTCFERPHLTSNGINDNLTRNIKFLDIDPRVAWNNTVDLIHEYGLQLGVFAEEPQLLIP